MNERRLYIGLMSGTSMDGIDAALIDLVSHQFIAGITYPYSQKTQQKLKDTLNKKSISLAAFSQLNTLLGKEFALAAIQLMKNLNLSSKEIIAIGSHGQTLCHDATATIPYTLQLGCAHTIAELTGTTVVADFRTRDLILGGQGAPFAPLYHHALFKRQNFPLAVINIGGVANITFLLKDHEVSGYDLGPGNCLMDAWTQKHLGKSYDASGSWASSGRVIDSLLYDLLSDSYFDRQLPKSIGKEYFSLEWLGKFLSADYKPVDVQATILMLTVTSIVKAVNRMAVIPKQIFICGGGAHNEFLNASLRKLLPEIDIQSTEALNINPDFIEAMMIAWLAEKTLSNSPLDLRSITGSTKPTILGAIYPAPIDK